MPRRTMVGALLAAGWAACRADRAPDEVVVLLGSMPADLDPRRAPDAYSDRIARLLFEPLLRRGPDGRLGPALAESVTPRDEVTWVARIEPGHRFADGREVDADDVVATYRSVLDSATGSVKRGFIDSLDAIEAEDARTAVFRLREPHAPFLSVLAGIGIAPSDAIAEFGADFRDHLTGSGPFVFDGLDPGTEIRLRKRDASADGPSRLRFRVIPDATVRALELRHGEADLAQNEVTPYVLERFLRDGAPRVERVDSNLVKYLGFNTVAGPAAELRVRRAIAAAIDVDALIRHKLRGFGRRADGFLPPTHWAAAGLSRPAFDPGKARAELDAAGLRPGPDGVRARLRYRTSLDATALGVARAIAAMAREVGLEVDIVPSEWGRFVADLAAGEFDLYTLTGVGIDDPDWFSFVLHSKSIPPAGANRPRYRNTAFDALLDEGRRASAEAARAAAYVGAQAMIAEDLPMLPLWFETSTVVSSPRVEGWTPRPDGDFAPLVELRWAGP